jgi:hypothetical protein
MRTLALCLVGLALASPVAAQHHHGQQAACPAGQTCPMHGTMSAANMAAITMFAPDGLLAQADRLSLSAEQKAQLVVIRDATAKAVEQAGTAPMNHAMCLQVSAALMSKAILTDAQRELVAKQP